MTIVHHPQSARTHFFKTFATDVTLSQLSTQTSVQSVFRRQTERPTDRPTVRPSARAPARPPARRLACSSAQRADLSLITPTHFPASFRQCCYSNPLFGPSFRKVVVANAFSLPLCVPDAIHLVGHLLVGCQAACQLDNPSSVSRLPVPRGRQTDRRTDGAEEWKDVHPLNETVASFSSVINSLRF